MDKNNHMFETIEAYLTGELSSQEKTEFENSIELDKSLRKEVNSHRIANEILINERLVNVQSEISRVRSNKSNNIKFRSIIFVAILFGGTTTGWFLYKKGDRNTSSELKEESYKENKNKVLEIQEVIVTQKKPLSIKQSRIQTTTDSIVETKVIGNKNVIIERAIVDNKTIDSTNQNQTRETHHQEVSIDSSITQKTNSIPNESISSRLNENTEYKGQIDKDENDSTQYTKEPDFEIAKKINLEISPRDQYFENFPFDEYANGTITIYSRTGNLIKELYISGGEPKHWDGTDKSGNVSSGYYIYKFESGEKTFTGGITVIN